MFIISNNGNFVYVLEVKEKCMIGVHTSLQQEKFRSFNLPIWMFNEDKVKIREINGSY